MKSPTACPKVRLSVPDPEAGNLPGALVFSRPVNDTYWKEFGPRFGIAYKVTDHMVVRAGYAMTNTPPIANNCGYGGFTFGYNGTVNVRGHSASGIVDDPAIYLSQPFPSLAPAAEHGSFFRGIQRVTTTARDANRPGYVQNYNFTIQYELPGATLLEAAYIGNKGTRLWGGSPGSGGYSELNGIPASILAMGDILNDPVSLHPAVHSRSRVSTTASRCLRRCGRIRNILASKRTSRTTQTRITILSRSLSPAISQTAWAS